ncbi:MAG: DUF1289 domain-containing protein [Pseudomonadota bacterium]
MTVASPCVGTCKLDDATGWCVGCARTGDEIAEWGGLAEPARTVVWDALPDRFQRLGVACRRLPWTLEDVREFVLLSLRERAGTWALGVVGAVAEFAPPQGARVEVEAEGDVVVASTAGGRLRFRIDDDVRALVFDPPETPETQRRVVLVVKRERGRLPAVDAIDDLGPDRDAIRAEDREARLFDLGLGRKEGRFCVRCPSGPARDALAGAVGMSLASALPRIGPALVQASPARVVESALGRIEVASAIPVPGGVSPPGPHTHLLPDHLATGRAMPTGMDLPRAYLPGAIFYPAR